ncbi:MAG TPA: chemotaxis protein CheW [Candidatus Polarisedimenticolia bacterium]|nr:chemotaxis protein CheW [Candidatus Polarisedimenticolia bacterium]
MKSANQRSAPPRRLHKPETVVLFVVAQQLFAIAADSVQEIRSTDSLAGAANEIEQPELSKVRHTIERGHRIYYVVNAGVHFGLPVTRPALVLILRQRRTAVLIDRIERMAEISTVYPLPLGFTGDERRWYRGLAYVDDLVIPVVQPGGFLTAEEVQRLDRTAKAAASQRELEGAVQA